MYNRRAIAGSLSSSMLSVMLNADTIIVTKLLHVASDLQGQDMSAMQEARLHDPGTSCKTEQLSILLLVVTSRTLHELCAIHVKQPFLCNIFTESMPGNFFVSVQEMQHLDMLAICTHCLPCSRFVVQLPETMT